MLAAPTALLAAATAGYTAYLFAQCEGRDLWQTPLLLPMLLTQAATAGAAAFTLADVFVTVPGPMPCGGRCLGGVLGHRTADRRRARPVAPATSSWRSRR